MKGFCMRCGTDRPERAAFCPTCGDELPSPEGLTWAPVKSAPTLLQELNIESTLTPPGLFLVALGLAALAAGLWVGFGMTVHSVGVDGTSLTDLGKVHTVNCGAAWRPEWRSVACEQALSGRRTAAWVLVIGGSVVALGAFAFLRQPRQPDRGLVP